jgi:hypothetical protein
MKNTKKKESTAAVYYGETKTERKLLPFALSMFCISDKPLERYFQ